MVVVVAVALTPWRRGIMHAGVFQATDMVIAMDVVVVIQPVAMRVRDESMCARHVLCPVAMLRPRMEVPRSVGWMPAPSPTVPDTVSGVLVVGIVASHAWWLAEHADEGKHQGQGQSDPDPSLDTPWHLPLGFLCGHRGYCAI